MVYVVIGIFCIFAMCILSYISEIKERIDYYDGITVSYIRIYTMDMNPVDVEISVKSQLFNNGFQVYRDTLFLLNEGKYIIEIYNNSGEIFQKLSGVEIKNRTMIYLSQFGTHCL